MTHDWQLAAAIETYARMVGCMGLYPSDDEDHNKYGTSLEHIRGMLEKMKKGNMSPSKMGRWLGWIQCAAVLKCYPDITLDICKNINKDMSEQFGSEKVVIEDEEFLKGQVVKIVNELNMLSKKLSEMKVTFSLCEEKLRFYKEVGCLDNIS